MNTAEVIEFYRDNGAEILDENKNLCNAYLEQVIGDTFVYNEDNNEWEWSGV